MNIFGVSKIVCTRSLHYTNPCTKDAAVAHMKWPGMAFTSPEMCDHVMQQGHDTPRPCGNGAPFELHGKNSRVRRKGGAHFSGRVEVIVGRSFVELIDRPHAKELGRLMDVKHFQCRIGY